MSANPAMDVCQLSYRDKKQLATYYINKQQIPGNPRDKLFKISVLL
jgi:hypothetical protein